MRPMLGLLALAVLGCQASPAARAPVPAVEPAPTTNDGQRAAADAPSCRSFENTDSLCAAWLEALRVDSNLEPAPAREEGAEQEPREPFGCGVATTVLGPGARLHELSLLVFHSCAQGTQGSLLAGSSDEGDALGCRSSVTDILKLVAVEVRGRLWALEVTEEYIELNGPERKIEFTTDRYALDELSYYLKRTYHDGHHEASSDNLEGDVHHVQLTMTPRGPEVRAHTQVGEILHAYREDSECTQNCPADDDCLRSCWSYYEDDKFEAPEYVPASKLERPELHCGERQWTKPDHVRWR